MTATHVAPAAPAAGVAGAPTCAAYPTTAVQSPPADKWRPVGHDAAWRPGASAVRQRTVSACSEHCKASRGLRRRLREYVDYFNRARPHQHLAQLGPDGAAVGTSRLATGSSVR